MSRIKSNCGFYFACLTLSFALGSSSAKAESSLESELQALDREESTTATELDDKSVASLTEGMYAVQTRYPALKSRFELTLGVGKNFTPNDFIVSQQADLGVRFHLSDRFHIALTGSYVGNSLSDSGKQLLALESMIPDAAAPKYRGDLMVGFNTVYGKIRITMDRVVYFDQYIALGGGMVAYEGSSKPSIVGDAGFAFWFGPRGSVRIGVKDVYVEEPRRSGPISAHNVIGHLDVGLLLGSNR